MLCEQHVPVRTSVFGQIERRKCHDHTKTTTWYQYLRKIHLHKICKCRMGVVIHCTYGEFGVAVLKRIQKCIPL